MKLFHKSRGPTPAYASFGAPARPRRRWLRRLALLLLAAGVLVGVAEHRVAASAHGRIADAPASAQAQDVALLLGTAPDLPHGPNAFYVSRLQAAAGLWKANKVRGFVVSGDNSRRDYDEPSRMKADLVAAGVPAAYVTCDYAGFSTLDSVLRARRVFGLQRVLIVSQRAHVERALYLADAAGLQATGLAAGEPRKWWALRQRLREGLARVKAVADVALRRGPHFLGPAEAVPLLPAPTAASAASR